MDRSFSGFVVIIILLLVDPHIIFNGQSILYQISRLSLGSKSSKAGLKGDSQIPPKATLSMPPTTAGPKANGLATDAAGRGPPSQPPKAAPWRSSTIDAPRRAHATSTTATESNQKVIIETLLVSPLEPEADLSGADDAVYHLACQTKELADLRQETNTAKPCRGLLVDRFNRAKAELQDNVTWMNLLEQKQCNLAYEIGLTVERLTEVFDHQVMQQMEQGLPMERQS